MSEQPTIHVHRLDGCRPTPLAHYLKALGILRLVAQQKDTAARGWWRDNVFHLATTLDRDQLEKFFLNQYSPTPMTASWLPRSGYSDSSSHSKTRRSLNQICDHPDD
jgi:CRISPR-associated protein Csx17